MQESLLEKQESLFFQEYKPVNNKLKYQKQFLKAQRAMKLSIYSNSWLQQEKLKPLILKIMKLLSFKQITKKLPVTLWLPLRSY